MTFTLHETVVLTEDMPAQRLKAGDVGAVVEVYGAEGVEVEFLDAAGRTKAVVSLRITQVRSLAANDVLAVRAS